MKALGALLAVVACAAMAAPAQAARSHLIGVYKVEKAIDIEGQDGVYTLKCPSSDIALDGMWRIDDVDQDIDYAPDPPPGFGTTGKHAWDVLESVLPESARATAIDTYEFTFLPVAGGDIRAHLFLTCLKQPTTTTSGHSHTWVWGGITSAPAAVAAGANPVTTAACPVGDIAIANGFDWRAGAARGNVAKRWPTTTAHRGWDWSFYSDGAGTVDVSWVCLRLRSNTSSSHAHRLVKQFRSVTETVKKNAVVTHEASCAQLYKAAVGAWDFGANFQHTRLWFLGMDPRPKVRAFKLLNADSVARNAELGALCLKDRTT